MMMKARLILFSGLLAGSVLVAASADEVVLYDAATPTASVVTTGGVVSVTGSWDLSRCGSFAVEIDGVDGWKDGAFFYLLMENENALVPDSRGNRSRGAFRTDIYLEEDVSEVVRPIPPAVPAFQACVAELDTVNVSGLFDLLWPNDCWGGKGKWGNEVKAWTLDPSRVVRVSFVQTGVDRPPRVRRIVARGPANRPVDPLPAFAQVPPERFFPFIDRYGQFKWRDWPGKVKSDADFARALAEEDADLAAHPGPAGRDKWGGWLEGPRLRATGSFRVEKVGGKWWFVDPDGYLWWSHGPVRVSPSCGMTSWEGRERYFEELPAVDSPFAAFYKTRDELLWPYYVKWGNKTNTYDFTASNLYRKYGPDWAAKWAERAHRRLRSWGANTIANSSDARVMRLSRTPYCDRFEIKSRPLEGTCGLTAWWPFRDPFDPSFRADVRRQLLARKAELDDPWCFGFFVDNELQWGTPGDLGRWTWQSPDDQPAKVEFRRVLKERYGRVPETPSAEDFESFSRVIVNAYFMAVREEFKRLAPQKLYMGCRFSGSHEFVIREAAKYVDVMSFNYYKRDVTGFDRLPADVDLPVIIGEFHFGALDRAPFCAGIIQLKDQAERGETYRRYLTSALRDPRFVGAHWHQYCDDVATGRFDGENFQIGWVDICDNPYPETIAAVRWVGENMYRIRAAVDPVGYVVTAEPSAVMVNFAKGADTRGFAWQTDVAVTNGELRLVRGTGADDAAFERATLVFPAESKRVKDPDLVRHRAFAIGLRPGETYSYRIGAPGHYATGTVEVKAPRQNVTILNLNDAQTKRLEKYPVWENTLAAASKTVGGADNLDFILSGGDLVDGWFLGGTNRVHGKIGRPLEWALAVESAAPFFSGVPWMSSSGNHDCWMYRTYMAVDYPKGVYPGCESVDYGNVHVVTVPYVHDDWSAHYEAVYAWLAKDLAENRRKWRDGWTVVALHWGPYTTGDHGARLATTNFIQRLTPLFASNRVDLVLQAHDHTYSKTLPYRWDGTGFTTNRNDRAVVNLRPAQIERDGAAYDHHPNGTYYLSCGAAGHRVGENVSFAAPTGTLSFTTRPYWIAADVLDVDSPWGRKGEVASADLPRSMFGVLRVDGLRLAYEAYVVGTNGTATLYDTLRISKEAVPEVPLLSERQKTLLDAVPENLSGSPALFDDASSRAAVAAAGWHPLPVRLSYGGRRCSGERVTVRETATGAVAWEGAGEGWFADAWNLKVGMAYDWTVTDASGCVQVRGSFVTEDRAPRLMKIEGVPNVRDLGGWRGLDGRRIRQGLVYRTSGFNDNATADCYDYEEVCRLHAEGRLLPMFGTGPESNDVRRLIAHLERGDVDVKRDVKDLFPKPNGWRSGKTRLNEATRRYLGETLGIRSDIDLRGANETWGMTGSPLGSDVRWFPCPGYAYGDLGTEEGKRCFARAFRVFLDPANYPIAFHCIGGQDRTGAVACILEALLGVEENDLWRDWQLSALCNDRSRFGGTSGTRRFEALIDVLKACSGVTLADKAAVYVKACGFRDADIAAVREFLLEPLAEDGSDGVKWIDGARLPLEGKGFGVTTRHYSRLPADTWSRTSPEIRALADHSSGLYFRFRTDSKRLRFRWSVTDGRLAGWNMAPQGKSGLDVYEEETGCHVCVGIPERRRENVASCRWNPSKTCLVYLPLFNGVEKVEVGVDAGCAVTPVSHPADEKPVVFYGGSIVQGACATRSGLAWVNIAGRLLGRETVNLGFSGQGCMEPELIDALSRIDAAVYVISPFGNMTREQADARYESGVRRLRAFRPETPIVLGEHCYYRTPHDWKHEAVGRLYDKLKAEGWRKLAIVRMDDMWPKGDTDGTADGGHPNDRGEWTMAEAFAAVVKGILQTKGDK
jgi:hypothetical protein